MAKGSYNMRSILAKCLEYGTTVDIYAMSFPLCFTSFLKRTDEESKKKE